MTECGADVAWDPAHRPAVYRLEIAPGPLAPASPPQSPARTRPGEAKHVPAIGSGPGAEEAGAGGLLFRLVYRGPECCVPVRGLAPGRRYRVRVRAEAQATHGSGDAAAEGAAHSRWARPEAELETLERQPLRHALAPARTCRHVCGTLRRQMLV